jgi:hypothetical protein
MVLQISGTYELGLSLPLKRILANLAVALLEGVSAHLSALSEALPDLETSQSAKEQRIRRFLSNKFLTPSVILPLLIQLLRPILEHLPELVLAMDRTHWKKRGCHINILMVGLSFEGRAIPLFWIVFDQAGNSSFDKWKTVLAPVIEQLQAQTWLQGKHIVVVADREFASPKLCEWLKVNYNVDSALRMKRSHYLVDGDISIQLADLLTCFTKGSTQFYPNISITNNSSFVLNVTITWDKNCDEPLIVATTLDCPHLSLKAFEQRFGIEPMFKDHKSNGFQLEDTKVTDPKRIESLLIPIALAHVFCTTEGWRKETTKETKPKKVKGKEFRAVGLFLVGLKAFKQNVRRAQKSIFKKFLKLTSDKTS